jgi:tripartite-type tricarboxylate transporter receptor subunit TctC
LSAPATNASYWIELLRKMAATPEWKRDLQRQHLADEFLSGAAFAKYTAEERGEVGALLKELDLVKTKKKE